MKVFLFVVAVVVTFVFSTTGANAQDTILFHNGDQSIIKVIEVTATKVRFKYWDKQDGPVNFVDNSYVAKIKYHAATSNDNTKKTPDAPTVTSPSTTSSSNASVGSTANTSVETPQGDKNLRGTYAEESKNHNPLYQVVIGGAFQTGTSGVAKDYIEALRWYRKAADQGYALGQVNVAMFYEFGFGVPIDKQEALRWYQLALAQGATNAKKIAEEGVKRLSQ